MASPVALKSLKENLNILQLLQLILFHPSLYPHVEVTVPSFLIFIFPLALEENI